MNIVIEGEGFGRVAQFCCQRRRTGFNCGLWELSVDNPLPESLLKIVGNCRLSHLPGSITPLGYKLTDFS